MNWSSSFKSSIVFSSQVESKWISKLVKQCQQLSVCRQVCSVLTLHVHVVIVTAILELVFWSMLFSCHCFWDKNTIEALLWNMVVTLPELCCQINIMSRRKLWGQRNSVSCLHMNPGSVHSFVPANSKLCWLLKLSVMF